MYLGHMSAVLSPEGKIVGIITLEDVIEELIGEEIVDESDIYIDVVKRIHVVRTLPEIRTVFSNHSDSADALVSIQDVTVVRHPIASSSSQEESEKSDSAMDDFAKKDPLSDDHV
jgi:CBS domain containing-hemolysin-like protein